MPIFRKTTEVPDYRLDWAVKKITWKQRKLTKEEEIEDQKKKTPYEPNKKKVRGALKKEILQKERKEFPLGRPMYSLRNVPAYPQVVYPKDVEKILRLSPRGARQYLARLRKEIGKKKGEVITITEFCDKTKIERNEVIMYLSG